MFYLYGQLKLAILLKEIAQAISELDNKTTHRQPPVLERYTPFFFEDP